MTSLAKQLQRLAVPHAQVVLGEDKKKASLLFDPKEAANIDKETFHALGLNGLEELETLDSGFEEFEVSLYGDSALTFERSVQTKEVNERLDVAIQRFLIRVSPYCLLKPAHKALEWLIHRFHIHLYNTDELILCFLPYHESKIFVRVLQLIRLTSKIASKWDWLEPLQKNGVHLPRKTLINHCRTDISFLSFVCGMIPKHVKVFMETDDPPKCRVLFSFYASTLIGVLERGPVTETMLSTLLPHLSRGLRSPLHMYKSATYMVLAQLLSVTKLKDNLLKTLQQLLAKSLVSDHITEAVSCIFLMFQTQDMSSIKITKKTFKYLCQHISVIDAVGQLYTSYDAGDFLTCLLKRLIPAAFKHAVGMATSGESSQSESGLGLPEYVPMLHRLLSTVQLPDPVAEDSAYQFIAEYLKHGNKYLDDDIDDRIKDSLQGIVRQLEGRHSAAVDRSVTRTLADCKSARDRDLVHEFLNLYVLSVPHQLVGDSETSLILSLNHRLPEVRQRAVNTLISSKEDLEDKSFLKSSVLSRLQDDHPGVVLAALQLGKDLWALLDDDVGTIRQLVKILVKAITERKWLAAGEKGAEILGNYSGDLHLDVFVSCLPCLFLTSSKVNISVIDILMKSPLFANAEILSAISKEWKARSNSVSSDCIGQQNEMIAACVAAGLVSLLQTDQGMDMLKCWTSKSSWKHNIKVACVLLVAIDKLVTMVTEENQRLQVCLTLLKLIQDLQDENSVLVEKQCLDTVDKEWSLALKRAVAIHGKKPGIPQCMVLRALETLTQTVTVPDSLAAASLWWQWTSDGTVAGFLRLSVLLYSLLLEGAAVQYASAPVYRQMLLNFNKNCFSDVEMHFKFLGLLWTQHANDQACELGLTLTLQARSLHLGLAILRTLSSAQIELLQKCEHVTVNLMIVTTSSYAAIREAGLNYLEELFSTAEKHGSVFLPLFKKISQCKAEILSDPSFIQQVIYSVFKSTTMHEGTSTPAKSKNPSRTRSRRSKVTADITTNSEVKDTKQKTLEALVALVTRETTPAYVQCKLLEIFSKLNNQSVLRSLLPLLNQLVQRTDLTGTQELCLTRLLQRFTPETVECLSPGSRGLEVYLAALTTGRGVAEDGQGRELESNSQITAITQMNKMLYSSLSEESQHRVLCALIDVGTDTRQLEITSYVRSCLKHLPLNGTHIEAELKKCLKLSSAKTVREAKRQKRPAPSVESEGSTEFDTLDWQRVTVVLENVQSKKKIANFACLVPVCFQIISSILESDNHTSAEYIKQLILTLLHNVCSRLDNQEEEVTEVLPEHQFNMELIVNCIRSSDNPQTHHHALLLLTAAARIYPEHLLHNMMSVFTFMGANIMRQDDAYSFHIISKILETVIPALIMACKQRKQVPKGITNDLEDIITMVIQVFVDSYPHIPEHRRHLLFNKLITVIGERQYLWRLILLMMKLVATKGMLKTQLAAENQESGSIPTTDTEFCLLLCADFTSAVQLSSAREMLEYVLKLPDDTDDAPQPQKQVPESFGRLHKDDTAIFNVLVYSGKQLRHFKYAVVNFLVSLFSSTDFRVQVSEIDAELRSEFQRLLETSLKFVSHFTRMANTSGAKPTAKFWKALQHKTHDMLDKLVSLLPDAMFVTVIGGLLSHDLPSIQRKAMELLNVKLQQQKPLEEEEVTALLPLVDQLCKHVTTLTRPRDMTEESSINCQTAFISLKLLCRNIGFQHKEHFIQVLNTSVKIFKSGHVNQQVCSCVLLCIAETCSTLKVHVIPHLATFMPALVSALTDRTTLLQNELYVMSVVTTVNKVVENLAHFLSPYLDDILKQICILSSKADKFDILQKPAVQLRLKTIRSTLSTNLPTRVLLPVVTQCYTNLVNTSKLGVISLLSLFGDHISHISREDLTSHLVQLQAFFLNCLDTRTDFPDLPTKKVLEIEGVAIETIIAMVMKLSESSFKPFLFKVFDWATTSDDRKDRVLVFYRLAERLSERLRSLFTLFAGHIISHAATTLDENNSFKTEAKYFPSDKSKRRKSCELLEYMLDCIYKCCLYDTQGFINKERFDLLQQPLVDQLENELGGDEVYGPRVRDHLVPCIVQLCVAAQDDSLWRAINYQICLKTRCEDPQVKEASLCTLDALHKKLGEDYMPLLPDTVPFLAELMEDESEEVEKKCHQVIRDMEKTLGEPLQKYF